MWVLQQTIFRHRNVRVSKSQSRVLQRSLLTGVSSRLIKSLADEENPSGNFSGFCPAFATFSRVSLCRRTITRVLGSSRAQLTSALHSLTHLTLRPSNGAFPINKQYKIHPSDQTSTASSYGSSSAANTSGAMKLGVPHMVTCSSLPHKEQNTQHQNLHHQLNSNCPQSSPKSRRKSKIRDLDLPVPIQQQVGELQVSVDHATGV